jgi:hypothetical protein
MPAFFVPSRSPEEAERLYRRLVSDAGIKNPQRVFRLCWTEKKLTLDGQVGWHIIKDTMDKPSDDLCLCHRGCQRIPFGLPGFRPLLTHFCFTRDGNTSILF